MIGLGTTSGSMGLELVISLARWGLEGGLSSNPINQAVVLYLTKYFCNLIFSENHVGQSKYHLHFME